MLISELSIVCKPIYFWWSTSNCLIMIFHQIRYFSLRDVIYFSDVWVSLKQKKVLTYAYWFWSFYPLAVFLVNSWNNSILLPIFIIEFLNNLSMSVNTVVSWLWHKASYIFHTVKICIWHDQVWMHTNCA